MKSLPWAFDPIRFLGTALILTVLASCSASRPATPLPTQPPTPVPDVVSPEPTAETAIPLKQVTAVVTDTDGYKMRVRLQIGKWVKGSDSLAIESAWRAVGGTGPAPLTSDVPSNGWGNYTAKSSAIFFGNASFENVSAGFPASDFGDGILHGGLAMTGWLDGRGPVGGSSYVQVVNDIGPMAYAIKYESELDTRGYPGGEDRFGFIKPKMTGESWGPAPFALGITNAFTPKHPEGNPDLTKIHFRPMVNVYESRLGYTYQGAEWFTVDISW